MGKAALIVTRIVSVIVPPFGEIMGAESCVPVPALTLSISHVQVDPPVRPPKASRHSYGTRPGTATLLKTVRVAFPAGVMYTLAVADARLATICAWSKAVLLVMDALKRS